VVIVDEAIRTMGREVGSCLLAYWFLIGTADTGSELRSTYVSVLFIETLFSLHTSIEQ
jgi:hypothetical protein